MAIQNGAAAKSPDIDTSRAIDTPELLTRLAEDLKARSGSDLPLSCFIEQVKMQLSRTSENDNHDPAHDATAQAAQHSSDCFKAWAMPE